MLCQRPVGEDHEEDIEEDRGWDVEDLGDTTTLADPSVVDVLVKERE